MSADVPQMAASGLAHLAFVPLEGAVKGDVITRRLAESIALGLLADGAQLPSEADLAAQFGVSTVTLRASLAELRRTGLVETRRGRGGGSFVKAPPAAGAGLLTPDLQGLTIDGLRDLRDLHCVVSGGAAALAAGRARGVALTRPLSPRFASGQGGDSFRSCPGRLPGSISRWRQQRVQSASPKQR